MRGRGAQVCHHARQVAVFGVRAARQAGAETGLTPVVALQAVDDQHHDEPHRWLTTQRVLRARQLLEETRLTVEDVAHRSGFGTAALLRHQFTSAVGVPPKDYRRSFSHR